MLSIITLKVGALQTNCYLVYSDKNNETLIIDPGDDAEFIKNKISQNNLIPKIIMATHGHFDHILAAFDLQSSFKIPFSLNPEDSFLVKNMEKNAQYYLKLKSDPPPVINNFLEDNMRFDLGSSRIKVISTPGHTPGSVCLYFPKEKWLFTGDTYFAKNLYGRTDFSYSSVNDLQESIRKIIKFPKSVQIFPGH